MLKLKYQPAPGAPMVDFDLVEHGAGNFRLSIGYSHATYLQFSINDSQHLTPIPRLAFVIVWDEGQYLDDGTAQDELHPLFEGFAEAIEPAESQQLNYVCFDPTYRASKEITVMSLPWTDATNPAIQSTPVLVMNVKNDADDDYAFQRQGYGDATVGNVIGVILDDQIKPLRNMAAAPPNGGTAYYTPDLLDLLFIPQEKLVFRNESVRDALQRLERYEPRRRLLYHPGYAVGRKWRFHDLTTAPQHTLTLNTTDETLAPFPVESLELNPVVEQCFGAVKIYGPQQADAAEFYWFDPANTGNVLPPGYTGNSLTPIGAYTLLEQINGQNIITYRDWQIVDPNKRAGSDQLPQWVEVSIGSNVTNPITIGVKRPVLLLSWDQGLNWVSAAGVWFDRLNGRAWFPTSAPFCTRFDDRNQGTGEPGQIYFAPNAVKLVWAPYIEPLSVRVPTSGFEGTCYSLTGREIEKRIDEPSLAVGYEYGYSVTTQTRRDQIAKLARAMLDYNKDVCWAGGAQLRGIDYSVCRLNKRVNFRVYDSNGTEPDNLMTTGWEDINCFLTDVTYDFERLTTTLTFSSNKLELLGEDSEQLKHRLGIRALEQSLRTQQTNLFRTEFNYRGEAMKIWSGVKFDSDFVYTDTETGVTET